MYRKYNMNTLNCCTENMNIYLKYSMQICKCVYIKNCVSPAKRGISTNQGVRGMPSIFDIEWCHTTPHHTVSIFGHKTVLLCFYWFRNNMKMNLNQVDMAYYTKDFIGSGEHGIRNQIVFKRIWQISIFKNENK